MFIPCSRDSSLFFSSTSFSFSLGFLVMLLQFWESFVAGELCRTLLLHKERAGGHCSSVRDDEDMKRDGVTRKRGRNDETPVFVVVWSMPWKEKKILAKDISKSGRRGAGFFFLMEEGINLIYPFDLLIVSTWRQKSSQLVRLRLPRLNFSLFHLTVSSVVGQQTLGRDAMHASQAKADENVIEFWSDGGG